jgi:hypothetical protein
MTTHSFSGWTRPVLALAIGGCTQGGGIDIDELCEDEACTPLDADGGQDDEGPASDEEESGDTGADDDGGSGDPPRGGIPCDVLDVLQRNCAECHGEAPAFGAPMPLADYDDLQVPALGDPTRKVFDVVADRVEDDATPMPPIKTMTDEDRELLLSWIEAGAPEDPTAECAPSDTGGDDSGGVELPCEPDFVVTAHASGSEEPFVVPSVGADNLYMCFAFQAPFAAATHASAWSPIIDDERVVHHWILYRTKAGQIEGSANPCDVTLQVTTQFVAGWAPGGGNVVMPPDVGLDLGSPDDWYILQVHYNNTAHYTDAVDQSGVGFCTLEEKRPKTAGIVTLGSLAINIPPVSDDHEVTGTCSGLTTALWPEMHVMGMSPHMHELGRGMKSELRRLDGTTQMMIDVQNFDFNNQGMYGMDPEIIVKPGDTIVTTCTYDNPNLWPVAFGEGTNDEMCFNFTLAYPIDSLIDRNCGILY